MPTPAVKKNVNDPLRLVALDVVNRFLTPCRQNITKILKDPKDLQMVKGWYKVAYRPGMARVGKHSLELPPEIMTPLGLVCQVALALQVLERPLSDLTGLEMLGIREEPAGMHDQSAHD